MRRRAAPATSSTNSSSSWSNHSPSGVACPAETIRSMRSPSPRQSVSVSSAASGPAGRPRPRFPALASAIQRAVGLAVRLPAIDFRLRDLARLDQGIDATLGEAVPHLVHAHAQRRALDPIVAAIFVVVGATSLLNRLAVTIRMRSPGHAEERQAKSDK